MQLFSADWEESATGFSLPGSGGPVRGPDASLRLRGATVSKAGCLKKSFGDGKKTLEPVITLTGRL